MKEMIAWGNERKGGGGGEESAETRSINRAGSAVTRTSEDESVRDRAQTINRHCQRHPRGNDRAVFAARFHKTL